MELSLLGAALITGNFVSSFAAIPQKEKCWPNLDCHSEGIAKHLYPYKQVYLRCETFPLAFWGIYSVKLAIFQNSSSKRKAPLFQYVCLNFYFVVNHFILTQIYNKFVVNKILIINLFEANPYCITCSGYTLLANVMF